MERIEIGRVTHYFGQPGVAAIVLSKELSVGDRLAFEGHTTDFETTVSSIQIEHESVERAGPGESVGIRVPERVREHDVVYRLSD